MLFEKNELKPLLATLSVLLLGSFIVYSAPLYVGALIDDFDFTESQAGLIVTLEIGSVAIVTLLISNWLNKASLHKLTLVGVLLVLLANLITFWLSNYLLIIIFRVVAGIGGGLCLAVAGALLSRMSDPDKMMAILLACETFIMIIALIVMGSIKEQWQFDGIIAVFTLVIVLVIPFLFLVPNQVVGSTPMIQGRFAMPSFLLIGSLGLLLIFFFSVLEGGVWAFSERSGVNLNFSNSEIGMLLAMAQTAGLVGSGLIAVIGNKIQRVFPITVGILLMGTAGLLIYQTKTQLIYAISLSGFSFGFFISFPYLIGACARLDSYGRLASRANGISLLGISLAPFIAANVISVSDYETLGLFCFLSALFCIVLSIIFSQKLNKMDIDALHESTKMS